MKLPNPRENSLMGLNTLPRAVARPSLSQAVQAAIVLPPLPKAPADYYTQLEAKRERHEKWLTGRARPKASLRRALRPEPNDSQQFAKATSTTAERDRRLPPRAASALRVLRALAGQGGPVLTTYAALARTMNISRRHAIDLIRVLAEFGYISKVIRTASRGWHVGLAVLLAEKTLPVNERADWTRRFSGGWAVMVAKSAVLCGVKYRSPNNQKDNINLCTGALAPPLRGI